MSYIKRARRLLMHLEGLVLILSPSKYGHAALVVLQQCLIMTQFVLMISYLALARYGHSEGKRRAMSTISELVSVTKRLKQEDMDTLDPFPLVRRLRLPRPRAINSFRALVLLELRTRRVGS
jgi:hypothetical protein